MRMVHSGPIISTSWPVTRRDGAFFAPYAQPPLLLRLPLRAQRLLLPPLRGSAYGLCRRARRGGVGNSTAPGQRGGLVSSDRDFSSRTTGPDTGSVTPKSPPRSSSVSRNELECAIMLGRAAAKSARPAHSAIMQ